MQWYPIPDFEGYYEITKTGRVRSVERTLPITNQKARTFAAKEKVLTVNKTTGYVSVDLWKNNKSHKLYIHRLLATIFIPNPEHKLEVNHIDGNPQNNALENLEWVTSAENSQHAIRTGLLVYTNRLTEEEFLACLWDVIHGESYAALTKRVPYKVPYLSVKLRKIAQKHHLEHLLDESLQNQRVRRAQVNGAKNKGKAH